MKPEKRLILLGFVPIVVILYIILHEMGHCIVAVACGATITEFSILNARMSFVGGTFTRASDLWLHANGMMFPLIVSYIYMLLYKKEKESVHYHIFSYFMALMPTCSLLAWVMIPVIYLTGSAPGYDDVTKFLDNFSSEYHPIFVTLGALVLMMLSVTLMVKKRIIQNCMMEFRRK